LIEGRSLGDPEKTLGVRRTTCRCNFINPFPNFKKKECGRAVINLRVLTEEGGALEQGTAGGKRKSLPDYNYIGNNPERGKSGSNI